MRSLNPASSYLHLGYGRNAPSDWLNVDGSWQVFLARHPWIKKCFVMSGLLPKSQAAIPWSAEVMRLDFRRPLPFQDGSFEAIYSSQTLELCIFRMSQVC
jgi:hypothetical protein